MLNSETLLTQKILETNSVEFREMCLKLSHFGREEGVRILPFRSPHLPYFSGLSPAYQSVVLDRLKIFTEICEMTRKEGHQIKNTASLTWFALKRFGFSFGSDLFSQIHDQSVIEFYDEENIQIFRNLKFFEVCSYTLEDIYCRPWPELFVRSESGVTEGLLQIIQGFYQGGNTKMTPVDLGSQTIVETSSMFEYQLKAQVNFLAPLFQNKRTVGFVAIEEAEIIRQIPHFEQEIRLQKIINAEDTGR